MIQNNYSGSKKINSRVQNMMYLLVSVLLGLMFFNVSSSLFAYASAVISFFVFFWFLNSLGNKIPILELIVFLCVMQWLLGPMLTYAGYSNHYKYFMYVPEDEYYSLAIPGILAFTLGLFLFVKKNETTYFNTIKANITTHLKNQKNLALKLILAGWIFSIIQGFMPGSLGFIFFLLGNIMYIGLIYLFFQGSKLSWWLTSLLLFLMFVSSMQSTMFHGFLLWIVFLGLYIANIKQFSYFRKLTYLLLGMVFVFLVQIVKWEVRSGFGRGGAVSTFISAVENRLSADEGSQESAVEDMVIRLNQGWIISKIMEHIPNTEPYVDGETVIDAITSTLLPRFLNPSKKLVGGKEYFERFTGYPLTSETSMGASLLGEGYANFGIGGAVFFMFCVGLFYRLILNLIYKYSRKYPTLILWIPLIFLQVVKAESDLVRVLNHLVKASFLVFGIYWFCYKVLKVKI